MLEELLSQRYLFSATESSPDEENDLKFKGDFEAEFDGKSYRLKGNLLIPSIDKRYSVEGLQFFYKGGKNAIVLISQDLRDNGLNSLELNGYFLTNSSTLENDMTGEYFGTKSILNPDIIYEEEIKFNECLAYVLAKSKNPEYVEAIRLDLTKIN